MKILITGACGFIGRALIAELEPYHQLMLVDNQSPEEATIVSPGANERTTAPLRTDWPFVQAEVTDVHAIREAVAGMDAVVHLAASPTGRPEVGVETFSINAVGTYAVLDACRLEGISRFICASSINAFGTIYWRLSGRPVEYTRLPLTEDYPPVPEDPYSLSKLVNEETCAAFHRAYGITTAALRFAGVWVEETYRQARETDMPPTDGWSDDLWNWVHIGDVVHGIRQALEAPGLPGFGVYTLNAADTRCPEPTMELIERFRPDYLSRLIVTLSGRDALISTAKARAAFGYHPRFRLDE